MEEYKDFSTKEKIFIPILPQQVSSIEDLKRNLNESFGNFDQDKVSGYINQGLLNPLWDMLNRGGSSWRQVSSIILAEILGREMKQQGVDKNEDIWWLLGSIELIRLGTLICDDIEDQSDYRRKDLSLHKKYGLDVALNVGNFIYFYPHSRMPSSIPDSQKLLLLQIFTRALTLGHCGQNLDNVWRNSVYLPTQNELFEMNGQKGFVRQLYTESLAVLTQQNTQKQKILRELGHQIAIVSQTHNDIINIKESSYSEQKGVVAEDIYEGKKSLMIIHACTQLSEQDQKWLLEFLCKKKEEKTKNEVLKVLDILHSKKSVQYAENEARKKLNSVIKIIQSFQNPNNLQNVQKLQKLLEFTFTNF